MIKSHFSKGKWQKHIFRRILGLSFLETIDFVLGKTCIIFFEADQSFGITQLCCSSCQCHRLTDCFVPFFSVSFSQTPLLPLFPRSPALGTRLLHCRLPSSPRASLHPGDPTTPVLTQASSSDLWCGARAHTWSHTPSYCFMPLFLFFRTCVSQK